MALGILIRVSTHKEKWAIVAPTEDKARIIMDYVIDHIFDDPIFAKQLEYEGSKERLKQERSKTRITFRFGGEVRVFSADAGNAKKVKKALMGYGAANIILDEAALIPDELYATVKRMLAGTVDNFLLEIGNPSFNNHFKRTWFGTRYKKVFRDVYMALEEGRYSKDYIEEMREEAGFEWMFECLFPNNDEILPSGMRRLVSDLVIDDALVDEMPNWNYKKNLETGEILENKWGNKIIDDSPLLGIDVAGTGTNKCKFVIRWPKHNFAMVAATSDSDDEEEVADIAEKLIRKWNITDWRTVIDAGGVGHGLPSVLKRRGYLVKAILFGERDVKHHGETIFKIPQTFLNIRAWMYWEARKWLIKEGGTMLRDGGFLEMKLINYKQNSSLKTQIESKEDMIKRKAADGERVESPDTADALVLTFVDTGTIVEEDDIYVD